jgi:hypothetical protein
LCKRSKLAGCHFQAIWENEQGDRCWTRLEHFGEYSVYAIKRLGESGRGKQRDQREEEE